MNKVKKIRINVGLLYLLPALVLITIVLLYPLYSVTILSFYHKHLFRPGKLFAGLANFQALLTSRDWLYSLRISIFWTGLSVGLSLVMGMAGALILNQREIRGRSVARALTLLPWLTPTVITAIIWMWLLNDMYGLVNFILIKLHLTTSGIAWFGEGSKALLALILIWSWRMFPFMTLMLLAGLQGIPAQLYEAARVDGASSLEQFIYITLPNLKFTMLVITMLITIWTFTHFDIIWLLTKGGPGISTEVLSVYAYKANFFGMDTGKASASSLLMFLVILAFSIIYLRLVFVREKR